MSGTIRVQFNDNEEVSEDLVKEVPAIANNAELVAALKSDEYKKSALGRALVVEALKKSGDNIGDLRPAPSKIDVANEVAARHAAARSLFQDPRYKSDPLFRYQVAQQIAAESKEEAGEGKTARLQTMSDTPGEYPSVQTSGTIRVTFEAQGTGPNKPEPQPRQESEEDRNTINLY